MKRHLLLPALLVVAACGQQKSPQIQLQNAWARPTAGQSPAAVYVTIENKSASDDRLIGASSDRAAMAMVHQNELVDGISRMRMAGEINIPAGERIEMAPGGTHVMLEGLRAPLKTGDRFDMVLRFKESGDKTVKVVVGKPEGQ